MKEQIGKETHIEYDGEFDFISLESYGEYISLAKDECVRLFEFCKKIGWEIKERGMNETD